MDADTVLATAIAPPVATDSTLAVQPAPPSWADEIASLLADPISLKYASAVVGKSVVPDLELEKFETFHNAAMNHAEAGMKNLGMMYLDFYVIWKFELWRARFEHWEDYCEAVEVLPRRPSKTSIKTKVGQIDRLAEHKVPIPAILDALEIAPTAIAQLSTLSADKLPDGDYARAVDTITELGPSEGIRAVNDWEGRPSIKCINATHDKENSRIYFATRIRPSGTEPTYDRDHTITDVDEVEAPWILERLGRLRLTVRE